jgi:uncharacterized damage-inducible protein DinB
MTKVRTRHIIIMGKTCATLGNILRTVTQEQAATLRDPNDGEKGWTALEVVGHLADFDGYFYQRAVMMLEQVYPQLPPYDPEALAIEHAYNSQPLDEVYNRLAQSRERFIDFFRNLTDDQWNRAGVHPQYGHFTMTDAVMQVCSHDVNHLEQITRILAQPHG